MSEKSNLSTMDIMSRIISKTQKAKTNILKKNQLFYSIVGDGEDLAREDFEKAFNTLVRKQVIGLNKSRKIKTLIEGELFIGRISFSPKGFAFINGWEEDSGDYFVAPKNAEGSFHEDVVIARKLTSGNNNKKPEAKVILTLEHTKTELVGTFQKNNGYGFVIPDDARFTSDIYIPGNACEEVISYEKVLVHIKQFVKGRKPIGKIVEVLGQKGDKDAEALSVIKGHGIRYEFPAAVKREASFVKPILSDEVLKGREDFRDKSIFTIDGEDAKDLDDAIMIEKKEDHYILGVYIADVSEYVKEGSAIDNEAFERGVSVYLLDRVIPMLPKVISNNVCSLNPGSDKLVLACEVKIDFNGNVIDSRLVEGIASSKGRLTYEEVNGYFQGANPGFKEEHPELCKQLVDGLDLAKILKTKREHMGSLEFDRPETKVELDSEGYVTAVYPSPRGVSDNMIEEFMLVVNQTVAGIFDKLKLPFIYRIHGFPRKEKIESFLQIAKVYGFDISVKNTECAEPKELKGVLQEMEQSEAFKPLSFMLLRSMRQAQYSPVKGPHFGLAFDNYCHFTSPIRRYPDLLIHRIIKSHLHGKLDSFKKIQYEKSAVQVAEKTSILERRAERAERDITFSKIATYMAENQSEVFKGYITGFNNRGLFITLDNSVSGYCKLNNFQFDQDSYIGITKFETYTLGMNVNVKICKQNGNSKELVFMLTDDK